MQHLFYNVTYSVIPINSWLLTLTLYSSVIKTHVCNDTEYSITYIVTDFDCSC